MLTPEERARIEEEEEQYRAEVRRRQACATWKGVLIGLAIAVGIAVTIGVIVVDLPKNSYQSDNSATQEDAPPAKQYEFAILQQENGLSIKAITPRL